MEAVHRYGWKDVKSIAQHVGTRTPTQVRTHAQKLFLRQQKETQGEDSSIQPHTPSMTSASRPSMHHGYHAAPRRPATMPGS